jgi:hypothetical protein
VVEFKFLTMKKITFLFFSFSFSIAQAQQIENSMMELWENVGQATEEPINWNSFKTAQGSFTAFASQQVQRSTAIRSGATGQYCARIWSKSTLGIVANGNLTIGRINMGSTTASDPNNYNITLIATPEFSEVLTTTPDSLVFWVKYTAANANDSARVHAIIHDVYELRDPLDANSMAHVVATAERNYAKTNGSWARISVPFNYVVGSPAPTPELILLTFTTNKTPGGGSNNDEVLVDDIQLIYNSSVGLNSTENESAFSAFYTVQNGLIINGEVAEISIVSAEGKIQRKGTKEDVSGLKLNPGIYFIQANNSSVKILVP